MKWTKSLGLACVLVALLGLASVVHAEQVTIYFQYRSGGARDAAVYAWIEEFERLHPEINVEYYPAPDGYQDRTLVSWASGTGPDVSEMWGDWAQDYARIGALLDLRPHVARDFTAQDIADFYPVAWDASFLKVGENAGIQFRIPRYMITTVYYYNEDLINQAGLVTPTQLEAEGNWTYESMRDLARKLTIKMGDTTTQYGFTNDNDAWRRISVWVRAFGGEFFNPEDPTDFVGDSAEAVEAITFLEEMVWVDGSMSPVFSREGFEAGTVAMMEEGNHAVMARYHVSIQDAFKWNLAPVPVGRAGRGAYTGDDGFVIWRDTPHPDAAWEFVKFLTSKRGQEIAAQYEGLAPVRLSAFPFYQSLGEQYDLGVMITNMADAGLPVSSFAVGNVGEIGRILDGALKRTTELGETSYARLVHEIAPVIEALARQ